MQPVVIGVAGGSGSGKSTLVDAIVAQAPVPCATLPFDNYYRDLAHLSLEARERINFDHPNSLDVEQFADDLAALKSGRSVATPVYDFAAHTRSADVVLLEPRPIVLVDGILLFVFPEICELLDLAVFVDVSDEVRTSRRVGRDVAERGRSEAYALAQIERTVRPMYGEFVHPSMDNADLFIDGTADPTVSAAQVLSASRVGAAAR